MPTFTYQCSGTLQGSGDFTISRKSGCTTKALANAIPQPFLVTQPRTSLLSLPTELLYPMLLELLTDDIGAWEILACSNFRLHCIAITHPAHVFFSPCTLWQDRLCISRVLRYGIARGWTTPNTPLTFSAEKEYCTPLRFALETNDYGLSEYFVQQGGDIFRCLPPASPEFDPLLPALHEILNIKCNVPIIDMLIYRFRDSISVNETWNSFTALHWACWNIQADEPYGIVEAQVSVLLHNGADPDIQDSNGNTALHFAAIMNFTDTMDILVCHGADYTIKNNSGLTPRDQYRMIYGNRYNKSYSDEPGPPRIKNGEEEWAQCSGCERHAARIEWL